jgi:choline dehydrogenase
VDSPDVGRNLRDHLVSLMGAESVKGTLFSATSARQLVKYLTRRKGMLTSNVAEAYGFVRSDPNLARPDLEIIWAPVAYVREGLAGIPGHGVGAGAILLQPESRGSVRLAGADPFAAPVIDPRYLTDPQGADRARLLAGLDIVQRILDTPSVSALTLGHYLAPEGGERMSRDELLTATLEYTSHTLYHPTSTARMGADDGSVVDPELRVRGVSGLRVADASVMPEIIRGHTHAPSVVIGEKAASLIASASAVPATT